MKNSDPFAVQAEDRSIRTLQSRRRFVRGLVGGGIVGSSIVGGSVARALESIPGTNRQQELRGSVFNLAVETRHARALTLSICSGILGNRICDQLPAAHP